MSMSLIEIEKTLKQLRLSGVRATLETRLIESQASNLSFIETFSALLQDELDRRQSRLLDVLSAGRRSNLRVISPACRAIRVCGALQRR